MKITVDAWPIMFQKTGVGYYAHHLLSQFVNLAPHNDYYLCDAVKGMSFYNMVKLKNDLSNIDSFNKIARIPFPFMTVTRYLLLLQKRFTFQATKIGQSDIFFGPNFRGVFSNSFKTVLTVHDMAHEYFPETVEKNSLKYFIKDFPEAVKKAHKIIAVSETTKNDLIRFLQLPPEKITVVYNGCDESFRPIKDEELLDTVRDRFKLPPSYILFVGTLQPRKNIDGLVEAFAQLCHDDGFYHDLVIAGGAGWKSEGLKGHIKSLGLEGRVHFTGYVDENDLPALYNLAAVFAFPSLYEGFGLPVLEAMACGVPVVTSNTSSIPEVAGDAAVLVDPHSADAIADGLRKVLTDPVLKKTCVEKGIERAKLFTWEQSATETLAVLRQTVDMP
jgi:glycosyltransferase involved in cell wall biosynthesis